MKLTVGPLPTAVYWRRRAIVLGALLLVTTVLWASCSGPSPKANRAANLTTATPTANSTADPATVLTPTVDGTSAPITGASASPGASQAATGSAAPAPANTPCADTELLLTASAESATAYRGAYLRLTLKVKNTSARPCLRDLGADHQELYLQLGSAKMWSSDACDAPRGSSMTTLQPNIEHSFTSAWNGRASSDGCANRPVPEPGRYQLFARLDTKISDPNPVTLT